MFVNCPANRFKEVKLSTVLLNYSLRIDGKSSHTCTSGLHIVLVSGYMSALSADSNDQYTVITKSNTPVIAINNIVKLFFVYVHKNEEKNP